MKMANTDRSYGNQIKTSQLKSLITCFTISLFLLLGLTATSVSASVSAYMVEGTYSINFDTGYGVDVSAGPFALSPSPDDPLGYVYSYATQAGSTATAAAGFWGYGTTDGWGVWLTEGTGVSQSHPDEAFTDPAKMTINIDFTLKGNGSSLHTAWYDAVYLNGIVGEGGYVEFIGATDMFVGTFSTGGEAYNSSAPLYYLKDTDGFFYVEVKNDACSYGDPCFQYLTDDNYLHFVGSYTFMAKNDGGQAAFSSPRIQSLQPLFRAVHDIALGLGLLGILPLRKKMN